MNEQAGVPCAIGLGSNLGDSRKNLEAALEKLQNTPEINIDRVSSYYETVPIGPEQPNYFNRCALLTTHLSPDGLLERLLSIEDELGRVRKERWGARTMDLDLLLYGDWIVKTPHLEIPHPRMRERAFVLFPLAEIASEWIDPVTKTSIEVLKSQVDSSGILSQQ